MGDSRKHRGAHPKDPELFAPDKLLILRRAAAELAWLLDRGYAQKPALTLVGARHQLHRRQREALQRIASPKTLSDGRRARRVEPAGRRVVVDGFNVIINIESALAGGMLLRGCDGWLRNLAKLHGSYRMVEETEQAVSLLTAALAPAQEVLWLLDRKVSNSGRLASLLRNRGATVEPRDAVDNLIAARAGPGTGWTAATADSAILDRVETALDLPARVIENLPNTWIIDMQNIRDDVT